jgi:Ger(x)C family germination protein
MKKRILALIIVLCLLLSGCFSYKDINKLLIVVTTIIDVDENDNVILYLEVFKPYRSEQIAGGKGQRLIYKSSGETILEAIRDLNLGTSLKLNFTQNKVLIFTKKAAEKGLDYFIDFLNRDQEFVLRQYMYIYEQDPEELLKIKLPEEEYIGIYLFEIPINQAASAKRYVTRIDDYLNNRLIGNRVDILTVLFLSKDHIDSKVRLQSSAVLKDDKMVGEMSFDETSLFNLMCHTLRTGTLLAHGKDDNIMTLEIVGSRVKTDFTYDGSNVKVVKNISIRTTFGSTQKPIKLNDPAFQNELIKTAEKNVKDKCMKLFESWKEKGIDIFKIQEKFDRAYPNEKLDVKDIIEITDMEVNVKMTLEGSSDVTDFID